MKTKVLVVLGSKSVTIKETGEIRHIVKTTGGDVWSSTAPSSNDEIAVVNDYDKGEEIPWSPGEKFDKPYRQLDYFASSATIEKASGLQSKVTSLEEALAAWDAK